MEIIDRSSPEEGSLIVVSLGGREDLLPDFCHPLGTQTHVLGRHEACSIQILDPEVSRQHFQIRYEEEADRYLVSDMKSANGTIVNGRSVLEERELREGDVVEVGDTRLIFTRKHFKDHSTALQHFRRTGEHGRGTLIR